MKYSAKVLHPSDSEQSKHPTPKHPIQTTACLIIRLFIIFSGLSCILFCLFILEKQQCKEEYPIIECTFFSPCTANLIINQQPFLWSHGVKYDQVGLGPAFCL